MSAQPKVYFSEEDYLKMERSSPVKNEYYRGEIFCMGGASFNHNKIASNLQKHIHPHLSKKKHCNLFGNDLRTYIPNPPFYTYPDLLIICGEPQFADNVKDTITNPVVIIEILSESTANYDKSAKFGLYRFASSFSEYILIDQYKPSIECFLKMDEFNWLPGEIRNIESNLKINIINLEIPLREIYEGIEFNNIIDFRR